MKNFNSRGYLHTSAEILDINIMVLADISRTYVLKNIPNPAMFPEVLNEEDTQTLDELTKQIFDFIPWWFHIIKTNR